MGDYSLRGSVLGIKCPLWYSLYSVSIWVTVGGNSQASAKANVISHSDLFFSSRRYLGNPVELLAKHNSKEFLHFSLCPFLLISVKAGLMPVDVFSREKGRPYMHKMRSFTSHHLATCFEFVVSGPCYQFSTMNMRRCVTPIDPMPLIGRFVTR
jgi:hypothetical protein